MERFQNEYKYFNKIFNLDCVFWSSFGRIVFYVKKFRDYWMMKKKGELTTQQIVGLIVLIVSFSVILILIFKLDLGETTNKEICHNSVVLKSKSLVGAGLDCRTNYVCISGGGKCEGISTTITKKIDMSKNVKEEVMKAIADEMVDCWWMFGEGKVDYIGTSFLGKKACAICSRIAFDKKISKQLPITYNEFYTFLNKEQKDKTQKYLHYFYNTNNLPIFEKEFNSVIQNYFSSNLEDNKQYVILTGMAKSSLWRQRNYLPVIVLEDVQKVGCDEFITKA